MRPTITPGSERTRKRQVGNMRRKNTDYVVEEG